MRPTALVTGAGRGIGRAIANALAHQAWVAAVDRAFPDPDVGSVTLEADVTRPATLAAAIDQIIDERHGLDWLVCAAGIVRDRVSWKLSDDEWHDVLAVNLTGAFNTVRAAAEQLRASTCGRVVLIGSINGLRGKFGQANYAAAKAGLVGLGRSLALEFARAHVTVNVVAPGFIDTPMTSNLPAEIRTSAVARTPLGRTGSPEDVAAAVRFLCSDEAAFITGVVLPVDGGQWLGAVA